MDVRKIEKFCQQDFMMFAKKSTLPVFTVEIKTVFKDFKTM